MYEKLEVNSKLFSISLLIEKIYLKISNTFPLSVCGSGKDVLFRTYGETCQNFEAYCKEK